MSKDGTMDLMAQGVMLCQHGEICDFLALKIWATSRASIFLSVMGLNNTDFAGMLWELDKKKKNVYSVWHLV